MPENNNKEVNEKDSNPRVEPSEEERLNPEEVEETLAFGYGSKGGDLDITQFMDKFLGSDRGDFSGKTILNYEQVHLLTRLKLIPILFDDELQNNHQKAIDEFIHGFEKRLTSLHGKSRDDVTEMVTMMRKSNEEKKEKQMLKSLFENDSYESE